MSQQDAAPSRTILPVLLSGGSGSRLWPVSRPTYPKQFLALSDSGKDAERYSAPGVGRGVGSMIQETALRVTGDAMFLEPLVICGADQRFLVAEHLLAVGIRPKIVLEPLARNTAFPIAVAALIAAREAPEAILAILPADHQIGDADAFAACLAKAAELAASAALIVTLGVRPTAPETGYGYILPGAPIAAAAAAFRIERFVEKPDAATAEGYLAGGRHLWNSGMFIASSATLIAAFEAHAPEALAAARAALDAAVVDLDFLRLAPEPTAACPEISFDYAVMERYANSAVIEADFHWSDLGSWQAIWAAGPADRAGNVLKGDVLAIDTAGSYLHADPGAPMIASLGGKNLIVVATRDAVLVADIARAQDVKQLVEELKRRNRDEAIQHQRAYRPWGHYEALCVGHRFQVKRILVKPGGSLSLQSHRHRAEHWVVVAGSASATIDGAEKMLIENESIYVPVGSRHRLANHGKIDLVLIEVQSGAYLGEDDIVRYEDAYARE